MSFFLLLKGCHDEKRKDFFLRKQVKNCQHILWKANLLGEMTTLYLFRSAAFFKVDKMSRFEIGIKYLNVVKKCGSKIG